MEPVTDAWGNELWIGDRIVYAVRQSSHIWMTEARIASIEYDENGPVLRVQRIREAHKHQGLGMIYIKPVYPNRLYSVRTLQTVTKVS